MCILGHPSAAQRLPGLPTFTAPRLGKQKGGGAATLLPPLLPSTLPFAVSVKSDLQNYTVLRDLHLKDCVQASIQVAFP